MPTPTQDDFRYMQMALDLATDNVTSGRGGPFGTVIVRNGEVIASAANGVTTLNDPTAHAEVLAIRAACARLGTFQLPGAILYTSCEPCPMCLGAIYWAHIDHVFYANSQLDAAAAGFDDSFIYREIEKPYESRRIPMLRLTPEDYTRCFQQWMKSPNRIDY